MLHRKVDAKQSQTLTLTEIDSYSKVLRHKRILNKRPQFQKNGSQFCVRKSGLKEIGTKVKN